MALNFFFFINNSYVFIIIKQLIIFFILLGKYFGLPLSVEASSCFYVMN